MTTGQEADRRRTTRIPFTARVVLSGTDAEGFSFAEETETVSVNKHGCSVRTSYTLALGQEVSLRTKDKDRVCQLLVAWLGESGTSHEGLVGLEWMESRRFWGIDFAPHDWGSE